MIEKGVYVLGGIKLRVLVENEYKKLCDFLGYAPVNEKFRTFKRIDFFNHIVYGLQYQRMMKRDNSTVMYMYKDGSNFCFGRVRFFLFTIVHDQTTVLAFKEKLESVHYSENSHVLKVTKTDDCVFVPIKKIKEGCLFLEIQTDGDDNDLNTFYVCRFPNKLEGD